MRGGTALHRAGQVRPRPRGQARGGRTFVRRHREARGQAARASGGCAGDASPRDGGEGAGALHCEDAEALRRLRVRPGRGRPRVVRQRQHRRARAPPQEGRRPPRGHGPHPRPGQSPPRPRGVPFGRRAAGRVGHGGAQRRVRPLRHLARAALRQAQRQTLQPLRSLVLPPVRPRGDGRQGGVRLQGGRVHPARRGGRAPAPRARRVRRRRAGLLDRPQGRVRPLLHSRAPRHGRGRGARRAGGPGSGRPRDGRGAHGRRVPLRQPGREEGVARIEDRPAQTRAGRGQKGGMARRARAGRRRAGGGAVAGPQKEPREVGGLGLGRQPARSREVRGRGRRPERKGLRRQVGGMRHGGRPRPARGVLAQRGARRRHHAELPDAGVRGRGMPSGRDGRVRSAPRVPPRPKVGRRLRGDDPHEPGHGAGGVPSSGNRRPDPHCEGRRRTGARGRRSPPGVPLGGRLGGGALVLRTQDLPAGHAGGLGRVQEAAPHLPRVQSARGGRRARAEARTAPRKGEGRHAARARPGRHSPHAREPLGPAEDRVRLRRRDVRPPDAQRRGHARVLRGPVRTCWGNGGCPARGPPPTCAPRPGRRTALPSEAA